MKLQGNLKPSYNLLFGLVVAFAIFSQGCVAAVQSAALVAGIASGTYDATRDDKDEAIEKTRKRLIELLEVQNYELEITGVVREIPMNKDYTAINYTGKIRRKNSTEPFSPYGLQAMFRTYEHGKYWSYTGGGFYCAADNIAYDHISNYDDKFAIKEYYKSKNFVDVGVIDNTYVPREKANLSSRHWDPGRKKYYRYDQDGKKLYE